LIFRGRHRPQTRAISVAPLAHSIIGAHFLSEQRRVSRYIGFLLSPD
jgi:hypothetical protein